MPGLAACLLMSHRPELAPWLSPWQGGRSADVTPKGVRGQESPYNGLCRQRGRCRQTVHDPTVSSLGSEQHVWWESHG